MSDDRSDLDTDDAKPGDVQHTEDIYERGGDDLGDDPANPGPVHGAAARNLRRNDAAPG